MKNWTNDFINHLDQHIDEDTQVSYGDRASIIDFIKKYMHKKQFQVTSVSQSIPSNKDVYISSQWESGEVVKEEIQVCDGCLNGKINMGTANCPFCQGSGIKPVSASKEQPVKETRSRTLILNALISAKESINCMADCAEDIYPGIIEQLDEAILFERFYCELFPETNNSNVCYQIGTSAEADFELNTWTFEMKEGFSVVAGQFVILPIKYAQQFKGTSSKGVENK